MQQKLINKPILAQKDLLFMEKLTHYKVMNLTSSNYSVKQSHNVCKCPLFCLM